MSFADELRRLNQQGERTMSDAEVEQWTQWFLSALKTEAGKNNGKGCR